jgi:hypothetical protein
MKLRELLVCGFVLTAGVLFATAASADRRVALVIGNSAYKNASSLSNTINDSTAIANLFKSVGFEVVISRNDLGVVDFKRAVREFLFTAENSDIAVVYYAGHGVEIGGTNYLVPVDAKLGRDYDVEDEAVALDRIIWALQSVKRLRLILLDACRDNPFPQKLRSAGTRATVKGGLTKIEDVSADTLVAYAAKAGSVSYDGDGVNSPYASALIKHLAEPGLDVRIALGRVRDEVLAMTGGRQEPFIYGSLGGATIPLVPAVAAKPVAAARQSPVAMALMNLPSDPVPPTPAAPAIAARAPVAAPAPTKVEPVKPPPAQVAIAPAAPVPAKPEPVKPPAQVAVAPAAPAPTKVEPPKPPAQVALAPTVLPPEKIEFSKPAPPAQVALAPAAPVPAKPEPAKPPAPAQAAIAPADPALVCSRDEARLARLRSDPSREEIASFQRELGCVRLRAQVQRLFESVAADPRPPTIEPRPPTTVAGGEPHPAVRQAQAPPVQQAEAPPVQSDDTCTRDAARLARLRADPTVEAITKFERELGCDQIRPQLRRLRESLGL